MSARDLWAEPPVASETRRTRAMGDWSTCARKSASGESDWSSSRGGAEHELTGVPVGHSSVSAASDTASAAWYLASCALVAVASACVSAYSLSSAFTSRAWRGSLDDGGLGLGLARRHGVRSFALEAPLQRLLGRGSSRGGSWSRSRSSSRGVALDALLQRLRSGLGGQRLVLEAPLQCLLGRRLCVVVLSARGVGALVGGVLGVELAVALVDGGEHSPIVTMNERGAAFVSLPSSSSGVAHSSNERCCWPPEELKKLAMVASR